MLIQRKHPFAGRALKQNNFPLGEDRKGNFGLKVGYLEDSEPILIALRDAREFANQFGDSLTPYQKLIGKIKPRVPFTHRIAILLIGKKRYHRILEQEEEEGD